MAEFRISRQAAEKKLGFVLFRSRFDELAVLQGSQPDLLWPDGWTEQESIALYRSNKELRGWLMSVGLIPKDLVSAAFPQHLRGQALQDFVLAKLPSEMTHNDRLGVMNGNWRT